MPPRTCIVLNLINRIFFLLKLNFSSLLKFLAFGFWRLPEIPWLIEGNVERMAFLGCSVGVSLQCRELTAVSQYPENDRLDHPRQWMCDSPRILYAVKEKKKKSANDFLISFTEQMRYEMNALWVDEIFISCTIWEIGIYLNRENRIYFFPWEKF